LRRSRTEVVAMSHSVSSSTAPRPQESHLKSTTRLTGQRQYSRLSGDSPDELDDRISYEY
jgi:hypothetical protein